MANDKTKITPKDEAAPAVANVEEGKKDASKKTTTKNNTKTVKTTKGDIKKRALEMLGKCCVRPKECKTRVLRDINGEPGPISKCYKRWEVFENALSVLSVSLLGASFFFSWVILRTTTFSYGQPMPMHIPGGCICTAMQSGGDGDGSTFCKDVLFTFNVAPQSASDGSYRTNTSTKSKASTTAYAQVWKSTHWWDLDVPKSAMAIAGATSTKDDQLQVTSNVAALVTAVNSNPAPKFLQFEAFVPTHPLYPGIPNTVAHWSCKNVGTSEEAGTPWTEYKASRPAEMPKFTNHKSSKYDVSIPTGNNPVCPTTTTTTTQAPTSGGGGGGGGGSTCDDNTAIAGSKSWNTCSIMTPRSHKCDSGGGSCSWSCFCCCDTGYQYRSSSCRSCNRRLDSEIPSKRRLAVEIESHMCHRFKTLQVRSVKKNDDNTKTVYFHDTLAELIVSSDTAHFHSPLCGQGPHLFLRAGLRGNVSFVSTERSSSGFEETPHHALPLHRLLSSNKISKAPLRLLDRLSSQHKGSPIANTKEYVPFDFETASKPFTRRLITPVTDCVTGKDDKMCQNGGTPVGNVCAKSGGTGQHWTGVSLEPTSMCGCNCPVGFSGEWCECVLCTDASEISASEGDQWAVRGTVGCETGPTCDCKPSGGSGNAYGLSCKKRKEKPRVWLPTHNQALCGKASCSDDKTRSRLLNGASSTPSASSASTTNVTDFGGCCSSPELLSKTVLSATPFCRANPEQYTVVQSPFNPKTAIKDMSHDSCWLRDHQSGERQEKYLEDYAVNWRHKQKWQQPDAMDSGSLTVMGLMLSVLCALIAFMDCQSNFLPEDHITSLRCNIPLLLRKLCLCKMFSIEDDIDTQGTVAKKMKIVKKVQTICETKFKALNDGRLDEFLVYLLINLPFNFMIACYTIVGPSLMATDDGELIRSDLAGVWQMGSPVAVEMVNLPTTFLVVLFNMNVFIAPLLTFAFVKTCLKKNAIKEDGKIDQDVAMNLYGKLCLFLSFFTWVFICIWMMANRFSNVLGTKFRFGDILLGVSLPFDVPSLQLPTAIFSFTFGFTKILILVGKVVKMGVDKFNDTKKTLVDVVPGQGVSEQTDDNAAVKGASEITIEGNAADMVKDKVKEKVDEKISEAQAKVENELEKKLKQKLKTGEEEIHTKKNIKPLRKHNSMKRNSKTLVEL